MSITLLTKIDIKTEQILRKLQVMETEITKLKERVNNIENKHDEEIKIELNDEDKQKMSFTIQQEDIEVIINETDLSEYINKYDIKNDIKYIATDENDNEHTITITFQYLLTDTNDQLIFKSISAYDSRLDETFILKENIGLVYCDRTREIEISETEMTANLKFTVEKITVDEVEKYVISYIDLTYSSW